jgi:tRNA 2-selenouridine synthase
MFENLLAHKLLACKSQAPIWLEDESQSIGKIFIYSGFFTQMQAAPVFLLDVPLEIRMQRLVHDYASLPKEELAAALTRITKRMGNQHAKDALNSLSTNDFEAVARKTLAYYDKNYRPTGHIVHKISVPSLDTSTAVPELLAQADAYRSAQAFSV